MNEQNIPDKGISINEAIGLLHLEDELNLDEILKAQKDGTQESIQKRGIISDFKYSISFVIPLPTYIPLPNPYHAAIIPNSNPLKMSSMSVVSITNTLLNLSLGEKVVPIRISVVLASISIKESVGILENPTKLHSVYLEALHATNDVLNAYKITPNRHNHFLQPLTDLNTPGLCFAAIYDREKEKIIQKGQTLVHEHMLSEILEARDLSEPEVASFIKIHTSMGHQESIPLWLTIQINEAIDVRCMGHHSESIILADHYTELVIRFLIYGILIAKGTEEKLARQKAQSRIKVQLLIEILSDELGYATSDFKNKIKFSPWCNDCRKVRNALSHEVKIMKITPDQSFKALDASTIMVKKMCEIVNDKYPSAINDTQWLMSSSWLTDSMKAHAKHVRR
jgi:hypothetical protein